MVIAGLSVVVLVLIAIARELNRSEMERFGVPQLPPRLPQHASRKSNKFASPSKKRPPPLPLQTSSSAEIARYNIYRISKHLKGEFVFPPVHVEELRSIPEESRSPVESPTHRRFKTTVELPRSPRLP